MTMVIWSQSADSSNLHALLALNDCFHSSVFLHSHCNVNSVFIFAIYLLGCILMLLYSTTYPLIDFILRRLSYHGRPMHRCIDVMINVYLRFVLDHESPCSLVRR